MIKELIVKSIVKAKFSGLSGYDKSVIVLSPELSIKDGTYKTGLKDGEQQEFEKKLGLKEGELAPFSPWWGENIEIRLENTKATRFILDGSPMSELKYRILLNSSKVAHSELDKHKNPHALFYIVDEEAKAKAEVEQSDYEFEAFEILMKLSPDEKRASLRLFGKKGVDSLSETVIRNELSKQIKKNPEEFTKILKDKKLKTRLLIEEFLDYGIVQKVGHYFKNGDDTIASSTDELIEYFDDIKNQSVKMAMTSRLTRKKAGKTDKE
jgi:hypothetical protein